MEGKALMLKQIIITLALIAVAFGAGMYVSNGSSCHDKTCCVKETPKPTKSCCPEVKTNQEVLIESHQQIQPKKVAEQKVVQQFHAFSNSFSDGKNQVTLKNNSEKGWFFEVKDAKSGKQLYKIESKEEIDPAAIPEEYREMYNKIKSGTSVKISTSPSIITIKAGDFEHEFFGNKK